MTTGFPLLRLPYLVLMPVLEQMEFMERIALSVLSKRARMFLKLLKMKSMRIHLILKFSTIEMQVYFDNSKQFQLEMYIGGYLELRYRNDVFRCNTLGQPPMDYVIWIMDVMHCKSVEQFTITKISECDIFPLLVNLPKVDEVVVNGGLSHFFSVEDRLLKVLRIVLPVSSAVTISYHFRNRKYLREILKGNFDAVIVRILERRNLPHHDMRSSLNDLRITNAKALVLQDLIPNKKDMNRFFKLWMKKSCNPRLEYLQVRISGKDNKDIFLEGLNAVQVSLETKIAFPVLGNVTQLSFNEKVTAEFDITRADGRTATIKFGKVGGTDYIYFYVWPGSTNDTSLLESLFMYMTTGLPLLRLPYLVLMPVLEQMEFTERIALSILSKRTRMFLKKLKMECQRMNLRFKYGTIEMEVFFDNSNQFQLEMYMGGYVELRYGNAVFLCNTLGLPPMDYALWIMDVMHCKSIKKFTIEKISQCDIRPLLVNLPKVDEVVVNGGLSDFFPVEERLLKVLSIVLPVSSAITISYHFQNRKYLREILKWNFNALDVRIFEKWPHRDMKFSLNDFWITNAKALVLEDLILDEKDLNRFFKMWMKKMCNHQLEYLEVIKHSDIVNKDLILKGLDTTPVSLETKRNFPVSENVKQELSSERITAEFDITRSDGRTATIRFAEVYRRKSIYFYVWPGSTNEMTTGFPLLRLPYLVLMPVLEQMEFTERIALSILSKRARMFLKQLKMECERINLRLEHNSIEMEMFIDNCKGFRVLMCIDKYQGRDYIHPYLMSFSCCPGRLPPMDYVAPIMDVTHCKSIKQLTIAELPRWDTLPLLAKN
ncbi:hypothetical protein GCK72_020086 [Caenorhabditis remanei]|uniref:F-box domain-containing protein n=1 Tax=Caenorhabditis remanei TaxID=31234 RepID=A0A6A5GGI6_CAERE|nr:hypothetical protein GCK72_020086 [Caenorhabditis remanei]KAF1753529.1 hypothetical protein GCK72_020086 [Caenorhabditis remanei]